MSRALNRRVRKLEQFGRAKPRNVVVYEPEDDLEQAERQIAQLRAAGLISEADLIMRIRRFGKGLVPRPMIDGKTVKLPSE